jgi:hypothetical protein
LKTRGRKHTPGEKQLLQQVAEVFTKKKQELGAKRAAKELSICVASFYNYAAGIDLPRMEVLRDAQVKWGVKWELVDPSEVLRTREVHSPEQYVLSFLDALREEDVEVAKIGPEGKNALKVTLKIRFPT